MSDQPETARRVVDAGRTRGPAEGAAGGGAGFERLYRENRDDLYAYVASLVRDRAAAEDVTAAAFERAYRKRRQFDRHRGAERAWLFGIARNAGLDELRRRKRSATLTAETADREAPGVDATVERGAYLTLGTEPDQVRPLAAEVQGVVTRHRAIVLSSSIRTGAAGRQSARFSLMVPSAELEQTLGDLSALADVLERNDSAVDITAPIVSTADRLRTARAEVQGLLDRLAGANASGVATEEELDEIESELQRAQRRQAQMRSSMDDLERRARYAPVQVMITSDDSPGASGDGSDSWSLADAAHDALEVLTVTAGVALVTAAALLPLALLALALLGARRLWIRRDRERALRDDPGPTGGRTAGGPGGESGRASGSGGAGGDQPS